jgi:hypothetical protein
MHVKCIYHQIYEIHIHDLPKFEPNLTSWKHTNAFATKLHFNILLIKHVQHFFFNYKIIRKLRIHKKIYFKICSNEANKKHNIIAYSKIYYKCPNGFFFNFLEKYISLTNSNMLNYDFSISNSIHYVIEHN